MGTCESAPDTRVWFSVDCVCYLLGGWQTRVPESYTGNVDGAPLNPDAKVRVETGPLCKAAHVGFVPRLDTRRKLTLFHCFVFNVICQVWCGAHSSF